MEVEPKDLATWGALVVGWIAQFFHLKGRVTLIEAMQKRDQQVFRDTLDRIDHKLDAIERKIDGKADK